MPTRIGLDTNFVVGMLDEQDLWRARTLELQTALEESGFEPVAFDCVLAEVVSILARRTYEKRRQVS